jgi:hypothetical protein
MIPWFVLGGLADSASIDIVFGELGKARPPVFSGYKFIGFPAAWVSYGWVIMIHFKEVSTECVIFWNIDVSAIEDDSIFKVPVFQSLGEGAGATVQDRF